MTPDGEFREAVARLHRAKDAVYRDAWKRRGEVISILANIARKVDRLEYGLDGAPATAGEFRPRTPPRPLVPPLKYPAGPPDPARGPPPPPVAGPARHPTPPPPPPLSRSPRS